MDEQNVVYMHYKVLFIHKEESNMWSLGEIGGPIYIILSEINHCHKASIPWFFSYVEVVDRETKYVELKKDPWFGRERGKVGRKNNNIWGEYAQSTLYAYIEML